MTLIDTSSWIEQLRTHGNPAVRERVNALLRSGDACWCAPVRLELWLGARGEHEKKVLRRYEQALPELEITAEVWQKAYELARGARTAAFTCPSPDVVIAACAVHHGVAVEAADKHFVKLMAL